MNATAHDHGNCTRHGCRLVVAPEEKPGAVALFSTPKSAVLEIDGWVFRRFPFADHSHRRCVDGVRREVYCPRCRFWWRVVRWVTLPYVMFR